MRIRFLGTHSSESKQHKLVTFIIDDVISTGATLLGMRKLIKKAGGIIVAEACVFTEGDQKKWKKVISLGNLPIFTNFPGVS